LQGGCKEGLFSHFHWRYKVWNCRSSTSPVKSRGRRFLVQVFIATETQIWQTFTHEVAEWPGNECWETFGPNSYVMSLTHLSSTCAALVELCGVLRFYTYRYHLEIKIN
jgi:hypothetical protein